MLTASCIFYTVPHVFTKTKKNSTLKKPHLPSNARNLQISSDQKKLYLPRNIKKLKISPDDIKYFARQLQDKLSSIQVIVAGNEEKVQPLLIRAYVSLYHLKFTRKSHEQLMKYFISNGLNIPGAKQLVMQLTAGVEHDNTCTKSRLTCILINDKPRFVNDYYHRQLRIFVPNSYFDIATSVKTSLLHPETDSNQIVSHIYGNANHSGKKNFYFINLQNYIGLNSGYIKLKMNRINSHNEVKDALYQYDFSHYSIVGGLTDYIGNFNSATQESALAGNNFIGLMWAHTNNLFFRDKNKEAITFFTPAEGSLQIKRNGKVIYQTYVVKGFNKISYARLPYGNYHVNLAVTRDNKIIYQQMQYIRNTNQYNYDDYDPYLRFGVMRTKQNNKNIRKFLTESGINFLLNNQWSMHAHGYLLKESPFFTIGANYHGDNLTAGLMLTKGKESLRSELNAQYGYLSLHLNQMDLGDTGNKTNFFWSGNNEKHFDCDMFVFYPLNNETTINASLFYDETKYKNEHTTDESKQKNNYYHSYQLGIMHRFKHNIYANTNYIVNNKNKIFMLNLNVPLDENINTDTTATPGRDAYLYQSVNYNKQISDSINFYSSASMQVQRRNSRRSFMTATLSQSNAYWYGSAHISKTSGQNLNADATIETTQFINKAGVFYTSKTNHPASVYIRNRGNKQKLAGTAKLYEEKTGTQYKFDLSKSRMLYFPGYSSVDIKFDFNQPLQYNFNARQKMLYHVDLIPGKIKYLDFTVNEAADLTVISSPYAQKIHCAGEGCLSTKYLTAGVSTIKIKPFIPFCIYSGQKICAKMLLTTQSKKTILCG